jgi:hypothetical protein
LSDLQWERVYALSEILCVWPLVDRFAVYYGESASASVHKMRLRYRAGQRLVEEIAGRAIAVLSEINTPCILLKGTPLSALLFEERHLRSTSDIDLLVDPQNVTRCIEALLQAGFLMKGELKPWYSNQVLLAEADTGVDVELHWRLAYPALSAPSAESVFELADGPVVFGGARTLGVEATLLGLLYHFQQHQGALKTILDVTAWVDRFGETSDLAKLELLLERHRLFGMLRWALGAVRLLVGEEETRENDRFSRVWQLVEGRKDWTADLWARASSRLLNRCLMRTSPWAQLVLYRTDDLSQFKIALMECAALLPVDGYSNKALTSIRPFFWGPHRIGRAAFAITKRTGLLRPERSPDWPH